MLLLKKQTFIPGIFWAFLMGEMDLRKKRDIGVSYNKAVEQRKAGSLDIKTQILRWGGQHGVLRER